jgi:hypothetical protein
VTILTLLSFAYYRFTAIELPKNLLDRGWQFGLGFLAFALSHRELVLQYIGLFLSSITIFIIGIEYIKNV